MDLHRLTPSELQHEGSRLKVIRDILGGTELSGIRMSSGGQLSPTEVLAVAIGFFLSPSSHRVTESAGGYHS